MQSIFQHSVLQREMAAVGESGVYCDNNTRANCYQALGSIIWVAWNRYSNIRGINYDTLLPDPQNPKKPQPVQLINVLAAGCISGQCSQFQGLESWIPGGTTPGMCDFGAHKCINPSDPAIQGELKIGLEAAHDIFQGGQRLSNFNLMAIYGLVGSRRYFGAGNLSKQTCEANNSTSEPCHPSKFGNNNPNLGPTYFWDHV